MVKPGLNLVKISGKTEGGLIYAVLGPKSYHIDVRVTHPASLSYVETACQGPLRAAEAAAQEKRRRYAAMAHADGADFVPFLVETFGGFGKDARTFNC